MKLSKSFLASSLLGVFLAVPATGALADGVTASAILGGTPFAIINYGTNVVKGRAVLISDGRSDSTKVIVKITGLKPGTAHIGHIHGGNCTTLTRGTIFHNLAPVVADGSGKGISKTEIPEGMEGLADCQWWIAFHEGAENPVPPLPQTPALAVGAVFIKGQSEDR